jgi:hypothetical protein
MRVTFVKAWDNYKAGNRADIRDAVAKDLVRRGVATSDDGVPVEVEPKPAPKRARVSRNKAVQGVARGADDLG